MSGSRNYSIDVFIAKAITYEGDDCLIWPFYLNRDGYAYVPRFGGLVSRYICKKVHGAPPTPKHEAAHSCSNPPCINNRHLRWATHKENAADDCCGEDNYHSKLTKEQVLDIRRLAHTTPQWQIARIYGIIQKHVSDIINKKIWAWLEEPCDAELIFRTTAPKMKDLFA
jgi:hypothetical protein